MYVPVQSKYVMYAMQMRRVQWTNAATATIVVAVVTARDNFDDEADGDDDDADANVDVVVSFSARADTWCAFAFSHWHVCVVGFIAFCRIFFHRLYLCLADTFSFLCFHIFSRLHHKMKE